MRYLFNLESLQLGTYGQSTQDKQRNHYG
jgi:hypothetical protein